MTDPTTTPEHHHHAAEPAPSKGPWKAIAIVLAVIIAVALIVGAIWLFAKGAPAPEPTPTPTASPTPTPTPTTPPVEGACTTDNSTVDLGAADAAAGSVQVPLIFTNTSSADCTLKGYPVVVFVGDGNGTQIGSTATQDTSTPVSLVTLAPGATATATLTVTIADVEGCSPTAADGFRITPPGSNDAFFAATTDYQACDNANVSILTVTAIAAN